MATSKPEGSSFYWRKNVLKTRRKKELPKRTTTRNVSSWPKKRKKTRVCRCCCKKVEGRKRTTAHNTVVADFRQQHRKRTRQDGNLSACLCVFARVCVCVLVRYGSGRRKTVSLWVAEREKCEFLSFFWKSDFC